jgi:PAS domain S-box-containing protein
MNIHKSIYEMSKPGKKKLAKNSSPDESLLLSALHQLSAEISSSHQLDQILTQSARQIKKILKVKSLGIFLLNDQGILKLKKGSGLSQRFQKTFDSEISQKLTQEILNRIPPVISNNVLVRYKNNRFLCDLMKIENIYKELSAPLKDGNRLIGVLKIWRDSSYPDFSERDLSLLKIIADQITIAINHDELCHQLQKSSEVCRNLIEGAPVSIVAVDLKGNITSCNQATEILTGYTKEELIGKHFGQLGSIKNKDLTHYSKLFKELLRGKKLAPFEMGATRKDGKSYWVEVHVSQIKSKGKVIGFQINTIDTTTRRQAEKLLIRKEEIATERARLLNDLRSLNQIDDILTRVCQAVYDSGLFKRAVMTLHQPGGRIIHLGQVGLPRNVVARAKKAPPVDGKLRSQITSPKFCISDSFFIPVEADLDYTKTMRYVPQKRKVMGEGDWRPGDELFVPLRDFPGEVMGYLSVDTPFNGFRPDLKTIQALEMFVEAAAARVREIQAYQCLSENEEKFRSLAEQSPNMIFIFQRGRVIYANRRCEEIMVYKKEEFYAPDFDFLTLIAPEDRGLVKASVARHVMGKDVDPYESTIITKEGKKIEAILTTKIISYRGENAILGIITDITERKRAEESLRKSESKYRGLIENLPQKIFLKDKNSIYISCNENYARDLKIKPEEITGKTDYDFYPRELAKKYRGDDQKIIRSGNTENIEERYVQNGREFWVQTVKTPIKDEKGRCVGLLGIFWDITERKKMEEELRKNEDQLRLITDALPVLISYVDSEQCYRFNNKAYEKWFGHSRTEVYGKHLKGVLGNPAYKSIKKYVERVLSGQEVTFEDIIPYKDGGARYVDATYVPHFGKQGEVRGFFALVNDITERKRAEEELQRTHFAIDSAPEGIAWLDKSFHYIYVNEGMCRMLGYTRDELLSLNPSELDLMFPQVPPSKLWIEMRNIKSQVREALFRRKDGTTFPVELALDHVVFKNEEYIFAIMRDTTDRKRAEEALRTERDRLETVTQNAGVGLAIISKDYRTLWANKVLKQMFGDVEGKTCYSTYNQRTEVCPGCGVREIFETGRPEVIHEQVGKDKDGKTVWSQIIATPIKDKEGNITAALEVVVDITERKEAEEKILESEEKYRLLVENASEAIVVAQDGWLKFVNPAMTNILGYSKEELFSKPFMEFIHPEDRNMVFQRHIKRLKGEELTHIYPFRIVTKDGEIKWLEINAVFITWDRKPATLNFLSDITERKRSEEVLRQSEERFRNIFENSPIALWEEDFSEVKKFIDGLKVKGVKDARKYFEHHPNDVVNCVKKVKVLDVNNAALDLFKAKGKEELQQGLDKTFTEESYQVFTEEFICIAGGRTEFVSEATAKTLKGDKKHVVLRWSVAPGYEKNLSKVLVSTSDVTELKRAREQNLLLETSRALSRTLKLDQVLKIAAEKMADALKSDRCSLALFDEKKDSAQLKYLVTKKGSFSLPFSNKRTPPDSHFSQVKETLMSKGYLVIANTKTDPLPASIKRYFIKTGIKSSLIISIILGRKLFGAFHILSEKLRSFTSEEISLARTIANQSATAIQNSRLIQDLESKHSQISEQADLLKTQYQEQKMLFELGRALSSTLDLDQMLKFATQKVTELLRTERSSIILVNPDKESATIKALYTQGKFTRPNLVGFTFDCKAFPELKRFLTRPKPIVIPDTFALPQEDPKRPYFLKQGKMRSTVAVPLKSRGKLFGLLTVSTIKKIHHYTLEEIQLLQTVANSIAVAIENSLLLGNLKANYAQIDRQAQTLKRQAEEREILLKISQELSGTFDLDRILQIATKEAVQALQVDRCGALLAFPEEGHAVIRSIYVKDGKSVSSLIGYKINLQDFPRAQAMLEKRKSIHIPNVYHLSEESPAKKYFIKQGIKSVLLSSMVHGKKLVGFLVLSTTKDFKTFTREEIRLAQTIANQVAVAIENARLLELVKKGSDDLKTLNLQLVNVQEDERKKIAQELHDQIGQTLFAMKMNLEIARKHLPSDMEEFTDIKNRLSETEDLLSQTIEQTRDLTTTLRPPTLDDFGLIPTLNTHIDSFSRRTNIQVTLRTKNFKDRLSSEIETLLYRITQEALTNVAKHARATQVSILLVQKKSTAYLSIEDNGIGFDAQRVTLPKDRLGLFSIKERVEILNGKFEIHSKPNKGTKLSVKIPITSRIFGIR